MPNKRKVAFIHICLETGRVDNSGGSINSFPKGLCARCSMHTKAEIRSMQNLCCNEWWSGKFIIMNEYRKLWNYLFRNYCILSSRVTQFNINLRYGEAISMYSVTNFHHSLMYRSRFLSTVGSDRWKANTHTKLSRFGIFHSKYSKLNKKPLRRGKHEIHNL